MNENSVFKVSYEKINAKGHRNIRGLHHTTIEITKEEDLSPRGDCIVGVKADKAVNDLSPSFKNLLKDKNTILMGLFYINGSLYDIVIGQGDPRLSLDNSIKIIFRKSTYIDNSTIAIRVNKAARDLNREMIDLLKNPKTMLTIVLIALKPLKIDPENICIGRIIEYLPISSK